MTIIETIKAEIERQRKEIRPTDTGEMKVVGTPTQLEQGWLNALSWMEKILDTIQEQPVDYEEELNKCKANPLYFWDKYVKVKVKNPSSCDGLDEFAQKVEDYHDVGEERGYLYCVRGDIKDSVLAGAKWQKEQMMKGSAIEGYFARNSSEYNNELIFVPGKEPPCRMATYWLAGFTWGYTVIPDDVLQDLKWEDEPMKAKLVIIKED